MPSIEREAVESSMIKSLGYDAETKTLAVEFQNGDVWHYTNVSQSEYDSLKSAQSIGAYFGKNFKGKKVGYKQ